eukprot:TRINITY_DN107278_c0_g1_i1.p1 TRINITY_DN107278_c0_g1~~TRINITY_DN107278_c0_g1_i1.p1  ORF type:complete len:216 (+),score=45.97 TRINITY_DN107278_c0_g1_i1:65-712(+)
MTLQMDDNRAYSPSDWLVIQKTEFNKEAGIRMSMSYGDFSATLKNEARKVDPPLLPPGIKRVPENREMMGITKGWRSRAYKNLDPKRPEVVSNRPSRSSSAGSIAGSKMYATAPDGFGGSPPGGDGDLASKGERFDMHSTSAMELDSGSKLRQHRTPLLARTASNAPFGLGLNRNREVSRTPKASSTSTLFPLDRSGQYSGCRRSDSGKSIVFGD